MRCSFSCCWFFVFFFFPSWPRLKRKNSRELKHSTSQISKTLAPVSIPHACLGYWEEPYMLYQGTSTYRQRRWETLSRWMKWSSLFNKAVAGRGRAVWIWGKWKRQSQQYLLFHWLMKETKGGIEFGHLVLWWCHFQTKKGELFGEEGSERNKFIPGQLTPEEPEVHPGIVRDQILRRGQDEVYVHVGKGLLKLWK